MTLHIDEKHKNSILKKIVKVEARIHRVLFSGQYKHSDFENNLIKLAYNNTFNNKSRYSKSAWFWIDNKRVDVFLNPHSLYLPTCYMGLNLENASCKKTLINLYNYFPELMISSVEYTIDIYLKANYTQKDLRNLFLLLVKYTYLPKQKKIKLHTPEGRSYTYCLGSNKKFKIYERGDDNKKCNGGWNDGDKNRIRIEYTAKREELVKYELYSLKSFIKDCKFSQICDKKINFTKFKNSSRKLPAEFEKYKTLENKIESFQKTYNYHKKIKTVSNPSQSIEFDKSFDNLKKQIDNIIMKFQNKWFKQK